VLLETVESGDVLVAERGEQSGLALEAGGPFGILGHTFWKYLDRHITTELGVRCPIHLSHASCTEGAEDLVASETVAS
jgi:hypothetical protein